MIQSLNDAFFTQLPKIELHCHLLGTVRKERFLELVRSADSPLTEQDAHTFYTRGEKPVGAIRVLRALDEHLLRSPKQFEQITYDYLQDAASHRVNYSEFSWNPTGTVRGSGLSYRQALEGIRAGMVAAEKDFGIASRVIAAVDREAGLSAAKEMLSWVIEERRNNPHSPVIGIVMDYREDGFPPHAYADVYQRAKEAGLHRTAHAGEFGMSPANIEAAIRLLGVERVDHGYTVLQDEALCQYCVDHGIVFTVVPTNTYYLRTLRPEVWAATHPIRGMQQRGLKIHPNTDDPTLHQVTPGKAWAMMHRDFGLDLPSLRDCMLHGIDAAWVDGSQKAQWRLEFTQEFDRLALE